MKNEILRLRAQNDMGRAQNDMSVDLGCHGLVCNEELGHFAKGVTLRPQPKGLGAGRDEERDSSPAGSE